MGETTITTTADENPHQSIAIKANQEAANKAPAKSDNEKSHDNGAFCVVVMSSDYLKSCPTRT